MARVVIESTFFVNDKLARILFDSGTSYSFIEQDLVTAINLAPKGLKSPIKITSPVDRGTIIY